MLHLISTFPFIVNEEIQVPLADEVHYTLDGEIIEVGSQIIVETLCYGQQIGYVQTICDNPFGTGLTAFIVSYPWELAWSEYARVEVSI